MKQKIILFLVLLTAAFCAHAYDFEVDGIFYHKYGNNVTVTYKTLGQGDYSGDLVIPETVTYDGVTYTVTTISYRAFDGCNGLTSVSLPSTITSVRSDAFWGCSALSSITVDSGNPKYDSRDNCNAIIETSRNKLIAGCKNTIIPNSVTMIGDEAFFRSGVTNIFIPSSITSIGKRAFSFCNDLAHLNVDSENPIFDSRDDCNAIIETSSNKLFAGCMNTIIPNTVTYINENAFYGCQGLRNMSIPNSVTYISGYAFYHCDALTNVTIGNSVTTIGDNAFTFSGLKEVTIPNSVKKLGKYAFSSCPDLTHVTLPNAISSLGECVFDGCSNLLTVTMPNYVSSISSYMFRGCTSLTSISIPSNVMYIGKSAFESCESLTSITIPNSVISIGEYAFSHCFGLTNVTIGNSVATIDGSAFGFCTSLSSILIPNSVTTINNFAFTGCSGLTNIMVESDNPTYDSRNNCNAIIETSSNSLIIGCKNTSIPNSVTSIGSGAFTYIYDLTNVTIPGSVNYIGEDAFMNCPNIMSITCFAITPPDAYCIAISNENINDEDYKSIYEQATLFVPYESLEAYRTHEEWGSFSLIVPFVGAGPGDTNGDGVINVADATSLIDMLLGDSEQPSYADVNGDGIINVTDVTVLIDMLLSSGQ
jgi:hypothetical protein